MGVKFIRIAAAATALLAGLALFMVNVLLIADVRHAVSPGDAFFVAAGAAHRFEHFSKDFATWAVFWGPQGGEADT